MRPAPANATRLADLLHGLLARLGLVRSCGLGSGLGVRVGGGMAVLYGKVRTPGERSRAEGALRSARGIREVWSLARVVSDARRREVEASDAALRGVLAMACRRDARFRGLAVAAVDDGVVLLAGAVSSEPQLTRAVGAVRALLGVRDVASLVRVAG